MEHIVIMNKVSLFPLKYIIKGGEVYKLLWLLNIVGPIRNY